MKKSSYMKMEQRNKDKASSQFKDKPKKELQPNFFYLNFNRRAFADQQLVTQTLRRDAMHFIYCYGKGLTLESSGLTALHCKPFGLSFICNQSPDNLEFTVSDIENQDLFILSIDIKSLNETFNSPFQENLQQYFKNNYLKVDIAQNFHYDKSILKKIEKIRSHRSGSNNKSLKNDLLYKLIIKYLQYFLNYQNNSVTNNFADETIAKIPKIISENLGKDLSEEDIALLTETEIEKIRYGCRHIFKSDLKALIDKIKLNHIMKMMRNSNSSLADIAFNTGFNKRSSFYRFIDKAFECTPNQLKKLVDKGYHI